MNKGPGADGSDARVRRGVWPDGIIVKYADEENRGIMFASSTCIATFCTTLALGEIMRISWLRQAVDFQGSRTR